MGEQIETTILFSDIRDFTAYTLREGDKRAFDLLQLHNQIAEAHICAREGELIKTYGDGMMVRFADTA
jgi:class 3 adenylate cyclase